MADTSETLVTKTISALKRADISSHDAARVVVAFLKKRERFEPEDIALCTTALIDKLRMLPMQDTIYTGSEGRLIVRGKLVKNVDIHKRIIEGAKAMRNNITRKLVREKVEFEAARIGLRKATSLWDIVFAQAALWFAQQEDEVYAKLTGIAGGSEPEESE